MAQKPINDAYSRDEAFWKNYVKGRIQVPPALFERIRDYHAAHGGAFDVVHDVGAGPGIHGAALRKVFAHVIESDVVGSSVELARQRLGDDGYSYRTAGVEDAADLAPGSVDCVFAASMIHHADLERAYDAIGRQLKPGGTLAIFAGGGPRLLDERANKAWQAIAAVGNRAMLEGAGDRDYMIRRLGRAGDGYDSIPVDDRYFLPGALRIRLNHEDWAFAVPDDILQEYADKYGGAAIKPDEQISVVYEPGWSFQAGMEELRSTMASLPLSSLDPELFEKYWKELEESLGDRKVDAVWRARLILATRK